ncbi:hypothetical protein E3E11_03230 [Oecophyllibacter saccharovorans]|uniref:Uncharacterized protein n=1 Tax=Oecophyllibacter saccharovorans TaxID=2558360 RepID=A0A506UKN7_9PROT|nr:hypothetical protein [Oecophyllibacter saccharovorans]QDH15040.1 hypothetical protein E3E11_03230 [Oecophyllibacter saccharovorans]TPW33880.1 hypothetical protein E3202_04625 [Oecophyllibacter saccharovorans]
MARLTEAEREALPDTAFALMARRAWPVIDRDHAEAALMDVGRSLALGHITPEQAALIRTCAHEVLRTHKSLQELRAGGWSAEKALAADPKLGEDWNKLKPGT